MMRLEWDYFRDFVDLVGVKHQHVEHMDQYCIFATFNSMTVYCMISKTIPSDALEEFESNYMGTSSFVDVDPYNRMKTVDIVNFAEDALISINSSSPTLVSINGTSNMVDRTFVLFQNLSDVDFYWSTRPNVSASGANRGFKLGSEGSQNLRYSGAINIYVIAASGVDQPLVVQEGV